MRRSMKEKYEELKRQRIAAGGKFPPTKQQFREADEFQKEEYRKQLEPTDYRSLKTKDRKGFLKLLALQDCKCVICENFLGENFRKIHWNHCHNTGVMRGILCGNCNMGLGHFRDNINNLESAIAYLKEWEVRVQLKVNYYHKTAPKQPKWWREIKDLNFK